MDERRSQLRRALSEPGVIVAPGVFDLISARIADRLDFGALYMTGNGAAASALGLPDVGLATYSEMAGRAGAIAAYCRTPLIADADTGYGGLLNVRRTVEGYEALGVAAIQIEDQAFPKRCGQSFAREVIPAAEMAAKVRVAVEARRDPDFLIVARTDAKEAEGLDAALARAELYGAAGADILFIEGLQTRDEYRAAAARLAKPLLGLAVDGRAGETPGADDLAAWGAKLAVFPALGMLAAAGACARAYAHLKDHARTRELASDLMPFADFMRLMGADEAVEFERRHGL